MFIYSFLLINDQEKTIFLALEHNLYSIAWKKTTKSKLTADVVGHVRKEISRALFFFISRGSKVVRKGGLELLLMVH